MGDKKKVEKLTKEITTLNEEIERLKKLCKGLKGNDNEMCSKSERKAASTGQHGIKDNVTRKQLREGIEERIDQLKRDVSAKATDLAKEAAK
ncbi:hypothetical protein [Sedimentitalea nanhaiensis]|uniref:Uncharacterized protein n=1 Tax=Sedimentitalea nanhaiensis TaxID=999627 RepID=A0A1I7BB46_9RHOB|nr:hypothetical protein [Sedimentitalea nanhaiensis]SFT84450.1 hypothetical protein SAMN05216236_10965 [Sedimentitalea nanhaiensis]